MINKKNNKSKIDDQFFFVFCGTVRLTKPYPHVDLKFGLGSIIIYIYIYIILFYYFILPYFI